MTPQDSETPIDYKVTKGDLLGAVRDLTRVVTALEMTLARDYPTKLEIKKRRGQIVFAIVTAIIASYFLTVGTVSYCFLQGIPGEDEQRACTIFPGWEKSFDNNRKAQDTFNQLLNTTSVNNARIVTLERQVAELEAQATQK